MFCWKFFHEGSSFEFYKIAWCLIFDPYSSPDSQANFCLLSSVQLGKGGAVKHIFSLDFYFHLYENSINEYFYLQIIFL